MPIADTTVITQLQTSLKQIEPDVDVAKGPLKRLFVDPHGTVVSNERNEVDRLIGIFTLQRVNNILTSELDAQTSAFGGMGRFQGRKSRGYQTFFTKTRPNDNIVINIGDQVGDNTSALIYRVTQQVVVTPTDLIKFYNPLTQRFEILAPIEAISIGADFDVPRGRVNKILGSINYIDGTINNEDIKGGSSVEDNESLDSRFQKRLEGQSLGTKGGLISELVNIPGVDDVVLITSDDLDLFSRRSTRSAIDIYVLGDIEATDSVSFTVTNSKVFTLPQHRITAITSVTLDGEVVADYAFIRDSSVYAGSVKEANSIELRAQPQAGSVVVVTYSYNSLLEVVQDRVTQFSDFSYFKVDGLVYEAIKVPVVVSYDFSFLSSFDKNSVMNALTTETMSYMNPNAFVTSIQPQAFLADLQKKVPVATSVYLNEFTSKENSKSKIETITLAKHSYPILLQQDLTINLRS